MRIATVGMCSNESGIESSRTFMADPGPRGHATVQIDVEYTREKEPGGMACGVDARAVPCAARARHGAAGEQSAQCREAHRHLHVRSVRAATVFLGHQVRERHRLAELFRP